MEIFMHLLIGLSAAVLCDGMLMAAYRKFLEISVQDFWIALAVNTGVGLFILILLS